MCYKNTILMAKPEGKLPQSRQSPSPLNFPNSGSFHKIFGMHLQKGFVYLYSKNVLPLLLHFWNSSLSPNRQVIFLIGAQAHLQIRLVRVDWCKVLKIIHCTISPAG